MKDLTKIVNRLKADCEKNEIEGYNDIHTIEEGLEFLAEDWTMLGTLASKKLFIKYGLYAPEYVKENIPYLYKLIKDKVEAKEEKELLKSGLTEEEIERNKLMESLGENRIVGYARVSSVQQHLGKQVKALEDAGCQVIFKEKKSGKNVDRIQFKSMMHQLKAGDTLIVAELTRLARSTKDLHEIVEELNSKGVAVKSLKEAWLDTTTAHGKLMFTILTGLAQFERELLLERQAEGIAVAKERGVKFGVKLSENADIDMAIALVKEGKYTMTQIAKMCHISRTTLWRRCKDLGII